MKYKFKNGAEVEGTTEQILAIAKSLGETVDASKLGPLKGYYNSEHMGLLKISDMNTPHLRNALLKRSKKYYETLTKKTKLSNEKFMQEFCDLGNDDIVVELFSELAKRK